jgi:hypothetical membrane protein
LQSRDVASVMRRGVYALGIIAPVFFAASVLILGVLKPGYNHFYHTMSELGETGANTALQATVVFILTGVMIILFGYGVQVRLRRDDKRIWTGVMIMLYGLLDFVGSGVFPVEAGGTADTAISMVHVWATVFGELAALGMPIWFYNDTAGLEEWSEHRGFSKAVFYLSVPLLLFLVYCIGGHTPSLMDTPIGLAQRLIVGVFLGWILFTGYRLMETGKFYEEKHN